MSAVEKRPHTRSPWREAFEAVVNRAPGKAESSVTIARNAKGAYQFEVTVRGDDASTCNEHAQRLADDLSREYPYANGGTE